MLFNQEPAKMPDRPYEKLSPESNDRMLSELTRWLEEGVCQPKMEPSLLGLDWSSFVTRKFPEYAGQNVFGIRRSLSLTRSRLSTPTPQPCSQLTFPVFLSES